MIGRLCFPPKLVSVLCVVQVTIISSIGVLLTGIFSQLEATVYERSFARQWCILCASMAFGFFCFRSVGRFGPFSAIGAKAG